MAESDKLTKEQLEAAKDLDHSILLKAGAGSGKTRVLVERFIQCLEQERASVGEIVAVTFTEKAAKEMRDRIRAACDARIAAAEDEKTRKTWRTHRRELETARISTIHGFCTRVLRENAVEAGVDPQFTVLDEAQQELLLTSSLSDLISKLLADKNEDLIALVGEFGLEATHRVLADLVRRRDVAERAGLIGQAKSLDAGALLQEMQAAAVAQAREALATSPAAEGLELLQGLDRLPGGGQAGRQRSDNPGSLPGSALAWGWAGGGRVYRGNQEGPERQDRPEG
jgi:ATP-dependent exoDNAse (exonuclease V) beta subunit